MTRATDRLGRESSGRAYGRSSAASVSAVSPPPTRCSTSAPSVIVLDDGDDDGCARRRRCWRSSAPTYASDPARPRPCPTASTSSSRRPGWSPTKPILLEAAGRGIPVWGEVELAWRLRGDRTPRRGCASPARTARPRRCRCSRRSCAPTASRAGRRQRRTPGARGRHEPRAGPTCSPSSCRAISCTGAPRCRPRPASSSTSRPTTSTGTAASTRTRPTRGGSTTAPSWPASTTSRTPPPSGSSRRPTSSRVPGHRLHPGHSGAGHARRRRRRARRPRVHRPDGSHAAELGRVCDLALRRDSTLAAPHKVANALAAAALARAHGVAPGAVRDGLRSFRPDAHRIAEVAEIDGVR